MNKIKKALYGFLACAMLSAMLMSVPSAKADTSVTTATLTAGTLAITSTSPTFAYVGTLTGAAQNLTSSFAVAVTDATGSAAGWKLTASITTLTAAVGGYTLADSSHTITGVTQTAVVGTAPTNNITYPMQIPTITASIFNAATATGLGSVIETFATNLALPSTVRAGTYTATLTVTIVSGP